MTHITRSIHITRMVVYNNNNNNNNNNKENQHRKRGEKMDRAEVLKPTRFCSFGEERLAPTPIHPPRHTYTAHKHTHSCIDVHIYVYTV
jgi:hypothetical protein